MNNGVKEIYFRILLGGYQVDKVERHYDCFKVTLSIPCPRKKLTEAVVWLGPRKENG